MITEVGVQLDRLRQDRDRADDASVFDGALPTTALAARILRLDEWSHAWGADRQEWPGFVLFTARPGADPASNRAIPSDVPAADADATLTAIVRHFETRGAKPRVLLTPLARPADWSGRLARAVAVQHAGFGGPPEDLAKVQRRTHEHLARPDQPWLLRYYLALLDGEPAGGATARIGDDLTGIYGVATLPTARRRGVATALLARILADARAAGHDLVFLSAHPGSDAKAYYQRLGFVPRFETRSFERP